MPEVLALGASRQSLVGQARSALPHRRLPQERSLQLVLLIACLIELLMACLIALRPGVRSPLQRVLWQLLVLELLRLAQARQIELPALREPAPLLGSIPRRWLAAPVL